MDYSSFIDIGELISKFNRKDTTPCTYQKYATLDDFVNQYRYATEINVDTYYNKYKKQLDAKGISAEKLNSIYQQDPTYENNNGVVKGVFIDWINKQLIKNYQKLLSEVESGMLRSNLELYQNYKKEKQFPEINELDVGGLEQLVMSVDDSSFIQKREMKDKPDYNLLFDNEELAIYKANNYAAAVMFGDKAYGNNGDDFVSNRWCVTQPTQQGISYYNTVKATGQASYFFHFKNTDAWYAHFGTEFQDVNNSHDPNSDAYSNSFSFIENLYLSLNLSESKDKFKSYIVIDIVKLQESETKGLDLESDGWNISSAKLALCIRDHKIDQFYKLIQEGVVPDEQCLYMAVRENNEGVVKYLIDNNLVTVTKEITNYSRHIGKNNEITKLLLLNTIDADDGTMGLAISSQDISIIDRIASLTPTVGEHALNAAINTSNMEIINKILSFQPSLNIYTLSCAVETRDVNIIDLILSLNPPVTESALSCAIKTHDDDIVSRILSLNPPISGESVYYAIKNSDTQTLANILSFNPTIKTSEIIHAIRMLDINVVNMLVDYVVASNFSNCDGTKSSLLNEAMWSGDINIVKSIANLNPPISYSTLPCAIEMGNLEIVRFILTLNPPITDNALMRAQLTHNEEIIDAVKQYAEVPTPHIVTENNNELIPQDTIKNEDIDAMNQDVNKTAHYASFNSLDDLVKCKYAGEKVPVRYGPGYDLVDPKTGNIIIPNSAFTGNQFGTEYGEGQLVSFAKYNGRYYIWYSKYEDSRPELTVFDDIDEVYEQAAIYSYIGVNIDDLKLD